MSMYGERVFPWILHQSMRDRRLVPYRQWVLANARGRVLEIGVGTGINLPLYGPPTERVIAIDPAPALLKRARRAAKGARVPVEIVQASAEHLPLDDQSIDTIVSTWTMCSLPDPAAALTEMRRVLRPDGALVFVEHGASPEPTIRRWQTRLDPMWTRLAGGCHLAREIDGMVRDAGFDLQHVETGYGPGPRLWSFQYQGATGRPAPSAV